MMMEHIILPMQEQTASTDSKIVPDTSVRLRSLVNAITACGASFVVIRIAIKITAPCIYYQLLISDRYC